MLSRIIPSARDPFHYNILYIYIYLYIQGDKKFRISTFFFNGLAGVFAVFLFNIFGITVKTDNVS